VIRTLACGTLGAAALVVGCQSIAFGPTKPDEPGPPPEQPHIEAFDEIIPQAAFGPVGPLRGRWPLAARLRLAPPNDAFSLFMSDIRVSKLRENGIDLWFRCQSVYVAKTESFGEEGAVSGGAPTCASSALGPPSWSPLDLRQISCQYELQLTAGTVSTRLDEVRLTFSSGEARTYHLDGPLLASASRRRVFLLDHGALEWTLAEGLRNGRAVTSQMGTNRYCD
jgi:hypothetical protein